ncbi:hypothetical protein PR001_g29729 [Phytophthora rubi]|uniref:Ty3 transposon capsid-like protein domain-containing protein n=1 Tax=Phytophthora rubi TaxID=129364 RepID=A0A6A3GZ51_9STRA|nr:hypothetical protein PR001_g29729 [Phytophthora rubi]
MTTDTETRDERAQRRAASAERAASEAARRQKESAPVTLNTDDGGTVTLEASVITSASGDTPLGSAGGGAGSAGLGRPGTGTAAGIERGQAAGNGRPANPQPGPAGGPARARTAATPIVVREKVKTLKLTKFKGLDDTMPVSMWLKTVRQEVRRQAVAMGVEWNENQLYHEVASHLDGEAKRWFAAVMESVQPEEESINTLATMLRAKYMTQRSGPEVVDLLNARRQIRGEWLVDYAQALREIAERGEIGDDWQVSAFLKGMSSVTGATHVRGHRPKTLDEALKVAIPRSATTARGTGSGWKRR